MSIQPKDRQKREMNESVPHDLPMPIYEYYVADSGSFSCPVVPADEPEVEGEDRRGDFLQNVSFRF